MHIRGALSKLSCVHCAAWKNCTDQLIQAVEVTHAAARDENQERLPSGRSIRVTGHADTQEPDRRHGTENDFKRGYFDQVAMMCLDSVSLYTEPLVMSVRGETSLATVTVSILGLLMFRRGQLCSTGKC